MFWAFKDSVRLLSLTTASLLPHPLGHPLLRLPFVTKMNFPLSSPDSRVLPRPHISCNPEPSPAQGIHKLALVNALA